MYNVQKATALAAYIIDKAGKGDKINFLKLLKLMYLCDRYMYEQHEKFITGDEYVSMKLGPVLSHVYYAITGKKKYPFWNDHITTKGYDVEIIAPVNHKNLLNEEELFMADNISNVYGRYSEKELVDILHASCSEWKNPESEKSAVMPLSVSAIKKAMQAENSVVDFPVEAIKEAMQAEIQ